MGGEANVWNPRTTLALSADTKRVTEIFTATEGQTFFTISDFSYVLSTGALQIFKNGILQPIGIDAVEQGTTSFSLVAPCVAGDEIAAVGYAGITGTVDVRDTDIFLATYQLLRDYAGSETTIYVQGTTVAGDGGEAFFQKYTGAAPGTYTDDGVGTIVPTGGDGSIGWLRSGAESTMYSPEGASAVLGLVQGKLRERRSAFDFMTVAQVADIQAKTKTLDVGATLATASTSIGVNGCLTLPPGHYKVDLDTASRLIAAANLEPMPGAVIYLYRTAGTNRLNITSSVAHYNTQFIDVTNVYATKALWDAAWNANGTNLPITFGYGTTSYNQFDRVATDYLCPQNFGAVGITGNDDTLATQVCFDMHKTWQFVTNHDVTQVTLRGNELNGGMWPFKLLGVPGTTDYSSILELKCGYSSFPSIRVDGQKSQYYQCGVHWYTNDLLQYYPGQNMIDKLYIEQCYLPLCIGGLPSQTAFAAQNDIVAAPLATDAPLSESVIKNLQTINCLGTVMVNQPNGKIKILGGSCSVSTTAGYSAPAGGRATLQLAEYSGIDVRHPGSELVITSGNINSTEASGTIPAFTLKGGTLIITGSDVELGTQGRIKKYSGTYAANGSANAGGAYVADSLLVLEGCTNMGVNLGLDVPAIVVENDAVGTVVIANCRPSTITSAFANRTAPFMMVTDTFTGLDAHATQAEILAASTIYYNPYMAVRFSNVMFKDFNPRSVSSQIAGILQGFPDFEMVGGHFDGSSSLDVTAPADDPAIPTTITKYCQSSGADSKIRGILDQTGLSVAASVATTVTDGGWTPVLTGTATFGRVDLTGTNDSPIRVGDNVLGAASPDRYLYALELDAGSGACTVTSDLFGVVPGEALVLSMFLRSSGTPGNNIFLARIKSYDHTGAALTGGDAEDDPISVFESNLSTEFRHFVVVGRVHKNATKAALVLYVENTAKVQVTLPDLN